MWGRSKSPEAVRPMVHLWLDVMLEAKDDRMERIAMVCKFVEEMKSHEPIISDDDDSNKKKELIPQWDWPTVMDSKSTTKNPPSSFQQLNKDLADYIIEYAKKKFANNRQLPQLTKSMKDILIVPKRFFKKVEKKGGPDKIRISAAREKQ